MRYGLVLDYLTRDISKQLYQLRTVEPDHASRTHVGLDVIRISLDHGVTPDALAPHLPQASIVLSDLVNHAADQGFATPHPRHPRKDRSCATGTRRNVRALACEGLPNLREPLNSPTSEVIWLCYWV